MNQNIAKVILPLAALSCAQGRMLAQDTARPNILTLCVTTMLCRLSVHTVVLFRS